MAKVVEKAKKYETTSVKPASSMFCVLSKNAPICQFGQLQISAIRFKLFRAKIKKKTLNFCSNGA